MTDKTQQMLETILALIQDQSSDIKSLHTRLTTLTDRMSGIEKAIIGLYDEIAALRVDVKENTYEMTALRETMKQHRDPLDLKQHILRPESRN